MKGLGKRESKGGKFKAAEQAVKKARREQEREE